MPNDSERLQILIEGKVRDFEKSVERVNRQIARMESKTQGEMRQIEASSRRAARSMERDFMRANGQIVASFSKLRGALGGALGVVGVGIGGAGLAGFARSVRDAAGEVAALGDHADKVGVTVEQLQALRIEFEKAGVRQSALDMGLQRFARRVAEAAQGTGELYKTINALGIQLTDTNGNLRPIIDIFSDYAQAIKDAESQQEALRLAFKAFDSEGAGMVNLLRQIGSEAKVMANSLNGAPDVITSDDVESARELDAAVSDLARSIDVIIKKNLLPIGQGFLDVAAAVGEAQREVDKLAEAIDRIGSRAGNSGFFARLNQFMAARGMLSAPDGMTVLDESLRGTPGVSETGRSVNELEKAAKDATDRYLELAKAIDDAEASGETFHLENMRRELARTKDEIRALDAALKESRRGARFVGGQPPGIGPTGSVGSGTPGPTPPIGGNITGLSTEFSSALAQMAAAAREAGHDIKVNSGFRSNERQAELFAAAVRKYGSEAAARKWVAPPGRSNHNAGLAADLGYGSDAARQWAHQNAGRFGLNFPMGHEPWHVEPMGPDGGRVRGANATPVAADRRGLEEERLALLKEQNTERERQQEAINAVNEALARELEMAGLENELLSAGKLSLDEVNAALDQESLVRQKLNALESAGVEVTEQMEAAIRGKIAALFELRAAADEARTAEQNLIATGEQMQQAFTAVGQPIVDTLLSIADGSRDAEDAIRGLVKQLASMVIQGALFGQGPIGQLFGGGIFGSLFSAPGRATGGPVMAGSPYVVGEKGPELFVPSSSGRILAAASAPASAPHSRQMENLRIELVSRFDADGGFDSAVERTSRPVAMQESRRAASEVARRVPTAVDARLKERDSRHTRAGVF